MRIEHIGLSEVNGSLVVIDGVKNASFEEIVNIEVNGRSRVGRIVQIDGERVIVQVFEGTKGISLTNAVSTLTGHTMKLALSKDILGRTFDGLGRPIDGMGEIYPDAERDINGLPMNPVNRIYPVNYINTGISAIDALTTLIRGQKLPIFAGSGMKYNELAAQIVKQANIADGEPFAVVFAAMGVKNDVAEFFRSSFESSGAMDRVVMFLNLSNDPVIERIITPRCALTAAEYLAFELNMHILVIMTDMTSYCEALREFSSSKGEIPGRKGYPGYMYSDLASLYERAGMLKDKRGSVTQIPILTMPNDDITNPVTDLTGYITEGQIVMDRGLESRGIYPAINVLASLSRLMKDGIGAGFTRRDHSDVANQLFSLYARVQDTKALASVIGEDELSESDRLLLQFGERFEEKFIGQGAGVNRSVEETLELGWELLGMLPDNQLDRISPETRKWRAEYLKERGGEKR
ncbi:MAG: V-type ATP synthase subunit B [Clostridia bacterium]|nr:V-type ATP synthase subunit B [Clostridia bacterium]